MLRRLLIFAGFAAALASGQPLCTSITGPLYQLAPSGAPVAINTAPYTGSYLDITLGYTPPGGPVQSAIRISPVAGVFSTCLVPAIYKVAYTVRIASPAGGTSKYTRTWIVPAGGGPYVASAVESSATVVGPDTAQIPPSQISQAGAATGNSIVWNGFSWAPAAGAAASSLPWGALTGSLSAQADLVAALAAAVSSAGATIPPTANLIAGNGAGNGADSGIAPANVVQTTGVYVNPAWITAIAYAKITGLPSFAPVATSGSASDLTTGTLPNARLVAVPNSALANTIITVNGTACTLGSTCAPSSAGGAWGGITGTLASQADLQAALNAKQATLGAASVTNAMLANTIITINGTACTLGASCTAAGAATAWGTVTGTLSSQADLQSALGLAAAKASNLSDLANITTARTNLGLAPVAASGSAADLATGTLPNARLVAIPNTSLANTTVTVNGTVCTLGSTCAPVAAVAWGAITGTLSTQTDLQTALNAKETAGAAATAQAAAIAASAQRASNLSDLANATTARTNLGLAAVASSGSAADLTTGTLPNARIVALPNANLQNASTTVNGTVCTLGSTCAPASTLANQYKVKSCVVVVGDPGAATAVLADDNDSPDVCDNDTGVDWIITGVACKAGSGSPIVTPILTGGTSTSVLTGALTCGTGSWAAGTLATTPTVHTFSGAGSATCASTPCSIDVNITTAGGTAKYLIVKIVGTV